MDWVAVDGASEDAGLELMVPVFFSARFILHLLRLPRRRKLASDGLTEGQERPPPGFFGQMAPELVQPNLPTSQRGGVRSWSVRMACLLVSLRGTAAAIRRVEGARPLILPAARPKVER